MGGEERLHERHEPGGRRVLRGRAHRPATPGVERPAATAGSWAGARPRSHSAQVGSADSMLPSPAIRRRPSDSSCRRSRHSSTTRPARAAAGDRQVVLEQFDAEVAGLLQPGGELGAARRRQVQAGLEHDQPVHPGGIGVEVGQAAAPQRLHQRSHAAQGAAHRPVAPYWMVWRRGAGAEDGGVEALDGAARRAGDDRPHEGQVEVRVAPEHAEGHRGLAGQLRLGEHAAGLHRPLPGLVRPPQQVAEREGVDDLREHLTGVAPGVGGVAGVETAVPT